MSNAPALTSTLDKYVRVPPPKDAESGPKTEIKITQKQSRVTGYIVYATKLLVNENEDSITIKAAGNAAAKGVLVAEMLRYRIPNLHQINKVTHVEVVDTWQPLEEGLDTVIDTKILPVLEIKLTKKPTDNELKDVSYQAPIPSEQLEKVDLENFGRRGGKKTGEPKQKKEGETEEETAGGEGRKKNRNRNRRRGPGGRGGNKGDPRGVNDQDYDRLEDKGEVFKQPAPFSDNRSNRTEGRRGGNQNQDRGQDTQGGERRQGDNSRNAGGNRVRLDKMPNLRKDPAYSGHGGSKHQGDKYEDLRRDDEGYGNRRQGGGNRRDNEGYDDNRRRGDYRGGNRRDEEYGDNRRQGDNRGGNRRDDQGYEDNRRQGDNKGGNRRDDQGYEDNKRQGQGQRKEEGRGQDRASLGDSTGLRKDPGYAGHGEKIQGDKHRDLVQGDRRQGDNRGGNRRNDQGYGDNRRQGDNRGGDRRDNQGYGDNRRQGDNRGGNRRDEKYGEEQDWEDYDRSQQKGGQQGNRNRGQNEENRQRYDDGEDREEQRNFRGGFGRGRARGGRGFRGVPRGGYSTRGGY